MTRRHRPTRSSMLRLIGLAGCAAALLTALADPRSALTGWLAATIFWSSLPLGALFLLLLTRLVPGPWRHAVSDPAEASLLLLPLAGFACLPVLLAPGVLFPWTTTMEAGAFRATWLTPWFFVLRSTAFLALSAGLAWLLLQSRRGVALAAAGLIPFVLLHSVFAMDWLMSLTPEMHSTIFGLYVLSLQVTIALSLLILLARAVVPRQPDRGMAGSLLLCSLLLWAYFAFAQYFIFWSGNAPPDAAWYLHRTAGLWGPASAVMVALSLGPLLLLILTPVRRSPRLIAPLCACVLLARLIEVAWLVLPAGEAAPAVTSFAAAFLGLGAMTMAILIEAPRLAGWLAVRSGATEESAS